MNKALITGVNGQDGSYLSELLLEKGYEVTGLVRRSSVSNTQKINHLFNNKNFNLVYGDVLDVGGLTRIIIDGEFDEIYNLACQSHVGISYECPSYTFHTVFDGCLNLLEIVRNHCPWARFLQAGSSEQFGTNVNKNGFQDESTPFCPVSPYAVGKVAAFNITKCYRESYQLHACSVINFNHESPRRGVEFVTRKITDYIGKMVNGKIKTKLTLGNLSASRDWGYAPDYVRGMWQMLQQEKPEDYVLATGKTCTVKDFVKMAFQEVGQFWEDYVVVSETQKRPHEVPYLRGDCSKAKKSFGWENSVTTRELVSIMVRADIEKNR